jgi:hypothetical protein
MFAVFGAVKQFPPSIDLFSQEFSNCPKGLKNKREIRRPGDMPGADLGPNWVVLRLMRGNFLWAARPGDRAGRGFSAMR